MKKKTDIVSIPTSGSSSIFGQNNECGFSYFETIGGRPSQEDALVWLAGLDKIEHLQNLSPLQVAERIWTIYLQLDQEIKEQKGTISGTTATSVYYDGKENLVTATIADSHAFAVVFGRDRDVLKVTRLNTIAHTLALEEERQRVLALQGKIIIDFAGTLRVNGILAPSRAIGDYDPNFRGKEGDWLVAAQAHLDITSIDHLICDVNQDDIESIELFSTCDGFTDGAANNSKEAHEAYLKQCLMQDDIKNQQSFFLCEALATQAIKDGSTDNVSVCRQLIYQAKTGIVSQPYFFGIYDGHGGAAASTYVAQHVGDRFRQICQLSAEDYNQIEFSAAKDRNTYHRDNPLSRLALQLFDFPRRLEPIRELRDGLDEHDNLVQACDIFLAHMKQAQGNWLANPHDTDAFFDACRTHIQQAQKSALRYHMPGNRFFVLLKQLINWFAALLNHEPVFKNPTYEKFAFFQSRVDNFEQAINDQTCPQS